MNEENKFSWFPENGNCPDVFDSIKEAIQDAQYKYDNGIDTYEYGDEQTSATIRVGPVRFFDFKGAVEEIVDGIEDNINEQMADFCSGCADEAECYITEKDKETFKEEAINALLPLIEKYVFINPEWVCTPVMKYDLKNKKEIEL